MTKGFRVGILGATGTVGQRFAQLLENHPQFEITPMAASQLMTDKGSSHITVYKYTKTWYI